jgi:sucrose-6-phosphate hydrolase SacC (GH32 family)
MAFSTDNGRTWAKYAQNPVVPFMKNGNRDPKVFWHAPSGKWVMALYLERGEFVLLGSENAREWEELSRVLFPDGHECPELFELPLDGDPANTRWVFWEGAGRHLIGRFDGTRFTPETEVLKSEWGTNCYAGQLWNDVPDGRALFIGWMRGATVPGTKTPVHPGMPFNQQMTFPREFRLRNTSDGLRLHAQPAREIEILRKVEHEIPAMVLRAGENPLKGIQSELVEVAATVQSEGSAVLRFDLRGVPIVYDASAQSLQCMGTSVTLDSVRETFELRALMDRTSLEIFVEGGRYVLTFYVQPAPDNRSLALELLRGQASLQSMKVWELASIWP